MDRAFDKRKSKKGCNFGVDAVSNDEVKEGEGACVYIILF